MKFSTTVQRRDNVGAQDLRANNTIPGVIYGPQIKPISIALAYNNFVKLYNEAGESSLIDVNVEGEKEPIIALIQDVQYEPVKNKIIHVDFKQIRMDVEMELAIELHFVGEASSVRELGGTFVANMETVNVKCLPKDLVSSIDVDISILKSFEDVIHINDLVFPAGIVATDDGETAVAKVLAPLTEEQLKAVEESGPKSVEEVKDAVEKKKPETEEAPAKEAKK